ncbi:MAG TPA: hypothetical protein VGC14_00110 [Rhizobium sp.]
MVEVNRTPTVDGRQPATAVGQNRRLLSRRPVRPVAQARKLLSSAGQAVAGDLHRTALFELHAALMKNFCRSLIFAAAAIAVLVAPAQAAEAVYPQGLRVGLVPMEGLTLAPDFLGFVSADQNVKVGVGELPEAAFTSIDSAVKDGKLPQQGPKPETFEAGARKGYFTIETGKNGIFDVRNYSLILPNDKFSGFVIVQVRDGADKSFSEEAIRKMLATTVMRSEVPVEEQLSQMSFKVSDLANFKTVRTIAPRSAVLLADGNADDDQGSAPYMMIGILQGQNVEPGDRSRFAQQVATTIPGLREARITSSEPIRIDGTPAFETRIDATGGKNDTPITVIQWLRFGNGGATLRIVGISPRDDWAKAFPRFRAVRDGIGPR